MMGEVYLGLDFVEKDTVFCWQKMCGMSILKFKTDMPRFIENLPIGLVWNKT